MNRVLVTGGAKNLGKEICLKLAESGFNLVIHYRHSEPEAMDLAKICSEKGVEAECIQGDFSTAENVDCFVGAYLKRFPQTFALVNNVGNYLLGSILSTSDKDWNDLFQTNFFAPLTLIRQLMPSLKESRGSIINIGTSGLNENKASTYASAYMMTKSLLLMLTKSLAIEVAKDGVIVNMVSPGFLPHSFDLPQKTHLLVNGRPVELTDVAAIVTFLLSASARSLTGQNIDLVLGN